MAPAKPALERPRVPCAADTINSGHDRSQGRDRDDDRSEKLAPIARLVEAQLLEVDPGRVRVQYAVKPEFMHPGLAVQGGIVTVYADMAMALAAETLCEDGEIVEVARATSVAAPRRRKAERQSLRAPDGVGAGEPEP
jgi:acyl-coenzyme A thioesterase PaaI-like protein